MKIRNKLGLAFGVMVAITCLSNGIGVFLSNNTAGTVHTMLDESVAERLASKHALVSMAISSGKASAFLLDLKEEQVKKVTVQTRKSP